MKIGRVLFALDQATRILDGGIITFPPKMADAIIDRVEKELASFYLAQAEAGFEKATQALALLKGELKPEAIKPPKLSKQAIEMLREQASDLLENELEDLELLVNSIWHLGAHKPSVGLSDLVNKVLPQFKAGDVKDLSKLDLPTLRVMQHIFHDSTKKYDTNIARNAWMALSKYTTKRSVSERDEEEARPAGPMSETERKLTEQAEKELAAWKPLYEFYKGFGVKPKKALHRIWEEPIDLTGVPEKYPLDLYRDGSPKITIDLFITKLDKPFGGRWFSDKDKMELIARNDDTPPPQNVFETMKKFIRSTIEHELRHMMQFFMRKSMKNRKWKQQGSKPEVVIPNKDVEHIGTAFPPKMKVPTGVGNAADRTAYPTVKRGKKGEKELYYLDPVEFYPQIGSWVDRFFMRFVPKNGGIPEDVIARGWKAYVGLESPLSKEIEIAPFYEALKTHDKRLWKKAVSEGWKILMKKVEAMEASQPKAQGKKLTTEEQFENQPVGTKAIAPNSETKFIRTHKGWQRDGVEDLTSKDLAEAVRNGMSIFRAR